MWNHRLASCLTFLLMFLPQPASPEEKPTATPEHPNQVEIVLSPSSITSIRVDRSPTEDDLASAFRADLLRDRAKELFLLYPVFPYPRRFSEDQMKELQKDQAKVNIEYHRQMRELLKEQYYIWQELHAASETLEQLVKEAEHVTRHQIVYGINIHLNIPVQGIQDLMYGVTAYNDAKAIIEDLKNGSVKSVVVSSEFRIVSTPGSDDKSEWKACKRCSVKAFIY